MLFVMQNNMNTTVPIKLSPLKIQTRLEKTNVNNYR